MPGKTLTEMVREIGRLATLQAELALPDAELLERYIRRRDETAFEALLHRHGPLVFGVCRRLLYNAHDAEDAFQATFLILARKANSIVPRSSVGNWLYGVAYRVAARARKSACHRTREQLGVDLTAVPDREEPAEPDMAPLLHAEVERLPDKYRIPIVLCYLEGKTNEEAARQLQWPVGTVKIRLCRARELLHSRLSRRGVALSLGLLAANTLRAQAPAALVQATLQAALTFAAGGAAVGGATSVQAFALTKGVLKTMFLSKLKFVAAAVLSVAVVAGAGGLAYHGPAISSPAKEDKKTDKSTDDKRAILGTWKAVAQEQQGQSKEDQEHLRLIFSDDEFTIKKGEQVVFKGKFKIDSSKKPKAIDMTITEAAKQGHIDKTGLGIYALDGDTLKWCVNEPGETERPKEFSATPGTRFTLITFKREKP
jgi:RNA polymerase sigma factor (sigma-70 family)